MLPGQSQLPAELRDLQATIQYNCNVSDARFASEYSMCVYLLKMREYYRWEKGYAYGDTLPREDIGNWLAEREELWEHLEERDLKPVEIDGEQFDPFDAELINHKLHDYGLLYSAGYGIKSKPHFFLARLEKTVKHNGYRIRVSSDEYARDLVAPPAMSLQEDIFIRRESLRRMLWERLEEWRWKKPDNAMGRAIAFYDFESDLDGALDEMTNVEIDGLILHEIGEVKAGEILDPQWGNMITSFPRSRLALMTRAVRDHLADCLSTLPALLERNHPPNLHFYFSNLSGIRKEIWPGLLNDYDHWVQCNDPGLLNKRIAHAREHWTRLATELLELHSTEHKDSWQEMESLIEQRTL